VSVVSLQVVKNHRQRSRFGVQAELQVAGIMRSLPIFPCDVAVVFHRLCVSAVVYQHQRLAKYAVLAVGVFGLSLSQKSYKPFPELVIAPFVALTEVMAGV